MAPCSFTILLGGGGGGGLGPSFYSKSVRHRRLIDAVKTVPLYFVFFWTCRVNPHLSLAYSIGLLDRCLPADAVGRNPLTPYLAIVSRKKDSYCPEAHPASENSKPRDSRRDEVTKAMSLFAQRVLARRPCSLFRPGKHGSLIRAAAFADDIKEAKSCASLVFPTLEKASPLTKPRLSRFPPQVRINSNFAECQAPEVSRPYVEVLVLPLNSEPRQLQRSLDLEMAGPWTYRLRRFNRPP